ncbi:hypothetical protein DFH08DRAFT_843073 [Mycena albidolilacea]|uniref:Transmembrane protein n=1 Tax=Mycena albidolilacea TaxID=1033008 RepID=A0AAD7AKJ0_9AGAR|nr:hypothetical protein DFH08DRAFT_843073 [Mycena albidolilacea]
MVRIYLCDIILLLCELVLVEAAPYPKSSGPAGQHTSSEATSSAHSYTPAASRGPTVKSALTQHSSTRTSRRSSSHRATYSGTRRISSAAPKSVHTSATSKEQSTSSASQSTSAVSGKHSSSTSFASYSVRTSASRKHSSSTSSAVYPVPISASPALQTGSTTVSSSSYSYPQSGVHGPVGSLSRASDSVSASYSSQEIRSSSSFARSSSGGSSFVRSTSYPSSLYSATSSSTRSSSSLTSSGSTLSALPPLRASLASSFSKETSTSSRTTTITSAMASATSINHDSVITTLTEGSPPMQPQKTSTALETETVTLKPPPAVMQPQEISTVEMETVISAAWTEWTADNYSSQIPPTDDSMESASPAVMNSESSSSMGDFPTTTMDDSSTTTVYGIRIGASASPTLSSSTLVFTTHSLSVHTSNSQVFTSSFHVTSTTVTLVPLPTITGGSDQPIAFSAFLSHRNTALIVGITVPLAVLLIAAIVAGIFFCRRRRQQRQRPQRQSAMSETSFFPDRFVSARSSLVDSAGERRLTTGTVPLSEPTPVNRDPLDDLELAGPQLRITSALETPSGVSISLRDTLAVVPTTTEPAEHLASCQASIIDAASGSYSPTPGESAATRQEQPARERIAARDSEEITVLDPFQRASADLEYSGVPAERRIEQLYSRIQELEREQVALRMTMEEDPPDYATNEG